MMKINKQFLSVLISVLICVFVFGIIVYATTTVGEDVTIGGTLTIGGVAPLKADGTVPLTANWDVGNFSLTVSSIQFKFNGVSKRNIVIGSEGGYYSGTNSKDNIAIGYTTGWSVTDGDNNIGIGKASLLDLTTGSNNIGIGSNALENLDSGGSNIGLGHDAGYNNVSGLANIFLGYRAGYFETDSNKLFIDNTPRASEEDARAKSLIYGEFDALPSNQVLRVNGFLGVGTIATPSYQLSVDGTASVSGTTYLSDTYFSGVASASDANGIMVGGGAKMFGGTASPDFSCTAGSLYIRGGTTDEDTSFYLCNPTNVWNAINMTSL
jgi:hypothetical protein